MKNNTKEMFLHTASTLFAIKGYHATGINEILKKAKLLKVRYIIIFLKARNNWLLNL